MKMQITLIFLQQKIMKKLLSVLALLTSCGSHKSEDTVNPLSDVQARGSFYINNLTPSIYTERCDKITFKALLSTEIVQDLTGFEVAPGQWQRDTQPCYPTESASTISNEGIISIMHHIWSTKDCAMVTRLYNYGMAHDWIMGAGNKADTDASVLSFSVQDEKNLLCGNTDPTGPTLLGSIDDVLSGYKGHVLASWIWLMGRFNGKINSLEKDGLNALVNASPGDPYYLALKARFDDGDQSAAINALLGSVDFPSDSFPLEDGVFGWGSAPASIYYLITEAVLEGK